MITMVINFMMIGIMAMFPPKGVIIPMAVPNLYFAGRQKT
jgi:hypothetical protein